MLARKSQQSAQNMELLAEKSTQTAGNMEFLTWEMHEIARKTKQETVSMKIITLVTLFFLPGTFISVGYPMTAPSQLTGASDTYEH